MVSTVVFGIICLWTMVHSSNARFGFGQGFGKGYSHDHSYSHHERPGEKQKPDKVGTWIKENQDEIVRLHNEARRNVRPSASDMLQMSWNKEAAHNAEKVAKKCKGVHSHASERTIEQPKFCTCGENIYSSTAMDPWSDVIDYWMSEENDFSYGKGGKTPDAMVGHYTQVVWSDSSQLGCYMHKCDNLDFPYQYICQYCPAGNIYRKMHEPYATGRRCSKCKGKCVNSLCVP